MTIVCFKALLGRHVAYSRRAAITYHTLKNHTFKLRIFKIALVIAFHSSKGSFDFDYKLGQHIS